MSVLNRVWLISVLSAITVALLPEFACAQEAAGYGLRFERLNALVFTAVFSLILLWYIRRAVRGEKFYMRPLAGLDAVDEAVGRATEMGRPILFVPGTDDLDNIQTIAGLAVLGRVAHTAARHRTPLRVPVLYPLALAGARETVRQARMDEGLTEPMDAETVQYVAGESFSYSARIGGMMLREKPAAGIYMGRFAAESLLIAEMGQVTGAIQIAGTAEPEQLPFFIVACDFTLMGEEFYAASAYLANEPRMLGALRGQDDIKILIVAVVLAGLVSLTFGAGEQFWRTVLNAK
jgi:hypothetical protein